MNPLIMCMLAVFCCYVHALFIPFPMCFYMCVNHCVLMLNVSCHHCAYLLHLECFIFMYLWYIILFNVYSFLAIFTFIFSGLFILFLVIFPLDSLAFIFFWSCQRGRRCNMSLDLIYVFYENLVWCNVSWGEWKALIRLYLMFMLT